LRDADIDIFHSWRVLGLPSARWTARRANATRDIYQRAKPVSVCRVVSRFR
jgi:hypothetical protein